ncbi:hypothetical protein Poli38472_011551 [Pythium oligandrum]|uniref:Heme haloperoxidase family profile domain-containing protein n=1 Tax=Pythium oligandrum TaxID=41045 RepID=A0A8K1CJB5_PYTOL|nr:hypothetical protein Poli38472_011551 [Pythium oligandrum]|eukprot:TMW64671.1 hypothetical protein Poli38472_011551 [Pythium oligandrum]
MVKMLLLTLLASVVALVTAQASGPGTVGPNSALAVGEYYRPLPPVGSGRVRTTAAYRRGPCPAINTLANHGYINRDGKNITAESLVAAAVKWFNVDEAYAATLVRLAKKPVFNLDDLSVHNNVEHDMSLVHKDAFFGQDPAVVDPELIDDLFGHVGSSGILDPWFFARTQQRRLRECLTSNPQCEYSNEFLLGVTLGRQGLVMRVMGAKNEEAAPIKTVRAFLTEERFPDGWVKSPKPIKQDEIQSTRVKLYALLRSSGDWLADGFGTSSQLLRSDANPKLCLQVTGKETSAVDTPLAMVKCDSGKGEQKFVLDEKKRLIVDHSELCLEVEAGSTVAGAVVRQAECGTTKQQKWMYDASGRLRPVHAPDLCMNFNETLVVMKDCGNSTEQRFFSYYANFQPSVSHITSIAVPTLCLQVNNASTSDGSAVIAESCQSATTAQQLTLDDKKRLVFKHTDKCLDVDGDNKLVQNPCGDDTNQWYYDSLGRMHPSSAAGKCLMLPNEKESKLSLVDCTDVGRQKWFVSDTKDADVRPDDQFYRPNFFESSGKPGTSASYSRSPCPAINALANHGYLPRSGRNITSDMLRDAVVKYFNIDPSYAQVLVELSKKTVFDLDDLSLHNAAEHDMSMVHADAFFGQDPAVTDPSLTADLLSHIGSTNTMDTLFFARLQQRRLKDCQARNPQCDFSNDFLMGVALGRIGLLTRGMGAKNEETIDMASFRSFLVDEKFPAGFTKSKTAITQADIQETRIRVYSLLKSSAEWLVDGFAGTASVPVITDADHTLCLEVGRGGADAGAPLMVAACDASMDQQKLYHDSKRRLMVEKSSMCLSAVDFGQTEGTGIVQLECNDDSNQQWTYDASGRLRPAHAPDLCLDVSPVAAGSTAVLRSCSAEKQQRYYSIYSGFHPNVSHLNSIPEPTKCIGLFNASSIELSAAVATTCDPLKTDQQITLDANNRLVFKHSNKCLAVLGQTTTIIQKTCKDEPNQLWSYDSLGRLHVAALPGFCMELSSNATTSVALAECSDNNYQQWFASDAKDPNNRPKNTYYKPNRDESSGRPGTAATYSRSPCPALNALANHGIISRDGRNISRNDLVGAVVATYSIEEDLAKELTSSLDKDYINLDDFSTRGQFVYDGSFVHADSYYDPDPAEVDPSLVEDLFSRVGSKNTVDLVYLAATQKRRDDAIVLGPNSVESSEDLKAIRYMKPGLLLRVMSGKNIETLSADVAKVFMAEERIPDDFVKPSTAVTQAEVEGSAAKVKELQASSGDWLLKGFSPDKEQIYSITKDGVRCLEVVEREFALAECDAENSKQKFTYDSSQRLALEKVDATTNCVDVVSGAAEEGAAVQQVECTAFVHQQWTYDASGRLHPQHAAKFCLEVAAGGKAVVNKCNDHAEQVFFTAYSSLAFADKQLTSAVDSPSLSKCLALQDDSNLDAEPCDKSESAQLFTFDAGHRLLMDEQCIIVSGGGDARADALAGVGECVTDSKTQQWFYDSLGRLHLKSSPEFCLKAGESDTESVKLAACAATPAQQWLVATLSTWSYGAGGDSSAIHGASPSSLMLTIVSVTIAWLAMQ